MPVRTAHDAGAPQCRSGQVAGTARVRGGWPKRGRLGAGLRAFSRRRSGRSRGCVGPEVAPSARRRRRPRHRGSPSHRRPGRGVRSGRGRRSRLRGNARVLARHESTPHADGEVVLPQPSSGQVGLGGVLVPQRGGHLHHPPGLAHVDPSLSPPGFRSLPRHWSLPCWWSPSRRWVTLVAPAGGFLALVAAGALAGALCSVVGPS